LSWPKCNEQFVAKGTTVDAGKDASGNKQTYKLLDDILVNDAAISDYTVRVFTGC